MNEVRTLLAEARETLAGVADDPMLDAQVLLAHVLGRDRSWLFAWPEHVPDTAQHARFEELLARRRAGHPVSHLTGEREFWSLHLRVTSDTLIPRPETEQLVEIVLGLDLPDQARVLDLGTGSGAIALALASERPHWRITAGDVSPAALCVARDNAAHLGLRNIAFRQGNWFGAIPGTAPFHLIVSNPPYIAVADPHLAQGDVRFEPAQALVAGDDGLDAIRQIVAEAPGHLAAGGWLWLEHGFDQGERVTELLRTTGFDAVELHHDLAGHARHSGGRWRPAGAGRESG